MLNANFEMRGYRVYPRINEMLIRSMKLLLVQKENGAEFFRTSRLPRLKFPTKPVSRSKHLHCQSKGVEIVVN